MAEETTPTLEGESTETTPVVIDEGSAPKQLREALKREQEKSAGFRTQLMSRAYEEAKLDPETGLGKAIAKEYDGEPTTEGLLEFAKTEYDYEMEDAPENAQAQAIQEGQRAVDQVNASSASVTPDTQDETLRKATSEKDYATAGAIKANKLEQMLKP